MIKTNFFLQDEESIEEGWSALFSSIGLLITSITELILSGYTCITLAPKLCGCLRNNELSDDNIIEEIDNPNSLIIDGINNKLKTKNMVHQWVIAQNGTNNKNQPIYVVQPCLPIHPVLQVFI